ncbi:MAG: HAD hydrolase-like protein [Fibrobacter sp.]|uniref:HAD-IIA family hydrolase n=1 Tax=Fibrobacter sp. TaxID=35828 RepID=UPI002A9110CC|nr:HAD family hydrolase [Fibrobacter sp.]MDY6262884.1 HAD hydrolase-like protein [Fibrobacter sp.]
MERLETEIYLRYKQIIESQGIVVPAVGESPTSRRVRMEDLLDRYDAFCFDGYGTLYNRGSFVYDGALDWYTMLRAAGKQMRLITNAASDVDSVLAADAAKRGFAFSEAETISSGSLLKDLCDELRGRGKMVREVYYIGRETGKHVLERCGITAVALDAEPAEPIVAISSAKDTPESYALAVKILKRPGAMLLVLNSDAWAPKIPGDDGVTVREPVSGALSERLRRDSMCVANGGDGCETYYLGKPFPTIWEKVKRSLPEGSRVLMVGDTLGTDVLGACVAGFDSALVVGRNVPADELESDEGVLGIRPDWYL